MLFSEALIKLFYQLQNRSQQRRQKSLELNHYPKVAIIAVTIKNRAADTALPGSKFIHGIAWNHIVPCMESYGIVWFHAWKRMESYGSKHGIA